MIDKAVILAGGMGERLKPITTFMPKPLTPVQGEPMLKKIVSQMEGFNVKEIVVLAGYKSELIKNYVSTISSKAHIEIVETPFNFSAAERLLSAESIIGNSFLLLYCDNFVTDYKAIKEIFESSSEMAFIVQERSEGNVLISENFKVRYTSETRSSEFKHVELGYLKVDTPDFYKVLNETRNLPLTLDYLSQTIEIKAQVVGSDSNLSVSNLKQFNEVNKDRRKILIDRDGILNIKMPKRTYLSNFDDFKPIKENWEALEILSKMNFDFIVATNQPGIATGDVDTNFLQKYHEYLFLELQKIGVNIYSFYTCTHHWDMDCNCRKPKPGMLLSAIEDFGLLPQNLVYIGDEDKDRLAAIAAGMKSIVINDEKRDYPTFSNIGEALNEIMQLYSVS